MSTPRVTGGGGTQLHLVETGNPAGRPILFIHGLSQCWLSWSRQLNSDLADDYRLVAMDLRGHGLSDKPREGYADSRLWADDINAVIQALALDHPILCGWSYGSLPIFDYLRHHGEGGIGGSQLVGGVSKLGSDEALAVLTAEFIGLVPGFFATDVEASLRSLESLIGLSYHRMPGPEALYLMLGYNLSVPPHVRQALLTRVIDNDDLLPGLRKPMLITHGAEDAVVSPVAAEQHQAAVTHAEMHLMAQMGHAPFWDDAPAFNRRLRLFAERL